MVTEWFSAVAVGMWTQFISHIPAPTAPAWFDSATAAVASIAPYMAWLGPWAPMNLLLAILTLWGVTWVMGQGLRVCMKMISYMTLGGGAT